MHTTAHHDCTAHNCTQLAVAVAVGLDEGKKGQPLGLCQLNMTPMMKGEVGARLEVWKTACGMREQHTTEFVCAR